jgi:hypothetical protein
VNLAVLQSGTFASYGSFTNLLRFDESSIATHKANQLPFWGMVERFRDKLHHSAMVLCLAQDHPEMDRITAESINGVGNEVCHSALADG